MTLGPGLEQAVSQLGQAEEQKLTSHPEMMELADYQDGLLDEKASEAIEEHMAVCRACADMLLTMAEPVSLVAEPEDTQATITASTRRSGGRAGTP